MLNLAKQWIERKQTLLNEFSAFSKQSCSAQSGDVKTFFRIFLFRQSHQFCFTGSSYYEAVTVLENWDVVGSARIDNRATANTLSQYGFKIWRNILEVFCNIEH